MDAKHLVVEVFRVLKSLPARQRKYAEKPFAASEVVVANRGIILLQAKERFGEERNYLGTCQRTRNSDPGPHSHHGGSGGSGASKPTCPAVSRMFTSMSSPSSFIFLWYASAFVGS